MSHMMFIFDMDKLKTTSVKTNQQNEEIPWERKQARSGPTG